MKFCNVWVMATVAAATGSNPALRRQLSERPNPDAPNLGYEELYRLQGSFWERFKYPNNVKEALSINSTIFSEDSQGRISDTRNFEGRELNTEYIFGLFVPSDSVSVIGQPGEWEILQFAANQNIASATTRVNFTFKAFQNASFPVIIDTWLTWNEKKEITQYDVVFRWFGYLLKTLLGLGSGTYQENAAAAVHALASSVCHAHTNYCNGTNTQYESSDACMNYLTKEIRVGDSFELGMNTLLCRSVHEVMVKYRPDVHCSHIGPGGGGMCDDSIPYLQKVTEQFFTKSSWIPTIF